MDFASSTLSTSQLIDLKKSIDPDNLIHQISEEFDCPCACAPKNTVVAAKGSHHNDDVAMVAVPVKKGAILSCVTCWNCGEKGHYRQQCLKPQKLKPTSQNVKSTAGNTKSYSPPSNSANAAIDDENGVWAISEACSECFHRCSGSPYSITLLDSGSTCHISLHCTDFTNL